MRWVLFLRTLAVFGYCRKESAVAHYNWTGDGQGARRSFRKSATCVGSSRSINAS